jgi:hypothetical protein
MNEVFYCKGRRLANFLISNGSKIIRIDKEDGLFIFVFEYDDSIDVNIKKWEANLKRCYF